MKILPNEYKERCEFHSDCYYAWEIESQTFDKHAFLETLGALIEYPERSSSVILRAEILDGKDVLASPKVFQPNIAVWRTDRVVLRKLLPRNPRLDQSMLQWCSVFSSIENHDEALVIYEPVSKLSIPFYHPQVKALAFHYHGSLTRIALIPLHTNFEVYPTPEQRTVRTMYQLLAIVAKHSIGYMNNYVKRVKHDLIVSKSDWQDCYTELKGKYAAEYVTKWVESTDPKKHVFEDLGIAAFLLNLHKQKMSHEGSTSLAEFIDIGCGNGLLVELLAREGHEVSGFDARERKSWAIYLPSTQAVLREMVLLPSHLGSFNNQSQGREAADSTQMPQIANIMQFDDGDFNSNQFLIGNHADELTPYIPLLAALASVGNPTISGTNEVLTAGFMIIPCCTYTFSGAKHNSLSTKGGRYASYISWLIDICEEVGWVVEREALRIPSTRNHAIIGRRRVRVEQQVDQSLEVSKDAIDGARDATSNRENLLNICRTLIMRNGGMATFLDRAMSLTSSKPRSH